MPGELPAGAMLANYRIMSRLGAGGMGEVYAAKHTQLERVVALKILPNAFAAEPVRLQRFLQEARVAASLNHPHIAHIYEIGETDGTRFIAMELVDGWTLDAAAGGGTMETDRVVEIALQCASALDEAHSKGIVHRDLKPANIMLTSRKQVKIVDFGLARVTQPAPAQLNTAMETQAITNPGVVMGTVRYMSPEQALGSEVDARSDIFSLGVVLYELITGRPPFQGATATETIDRIRHSQPESIARLNYNVAPEFERIVRKCLEKDCERRYQSARELHIDLETLKRDSAGTPSLAAQPRRGGSQKLVLTIAGVVALGAAAVGAYLLNRTPATIESLAVLPFANTSNDPEADYLSEGMTENLINRFSQLPKLRVMAPATVYHYKGADPLKAGNALRVRAVVTGRMVRHGDALRVQAGLMNVADGSQIWGQQYDRKPSDLMSIQDEIARAVANKLGYPLSAEDRRNITRRYTDNTAAYDLYLNGRFQSNRFTEEGFHKAIEYFDRAIQLDPNYALAYAGKTLAIYNVTSILISPSEALPKAKEAALKAVQLDDSLADAHAALGMIYTNLDRNWDAAERESNRALELDPNNVLAHIWFSIMDMIRKHFDEGLRELDRARLIDPLSPDVSVYEGWILYFGRRPPEAIQHLRKSLDTEPNLWLNRVFLAMSYELARDYPNALAEARRAVELQPAPLTMKTLAHIQASMGNTAETRKTLAELSSASAKRYVPPTALASLYAVLGEKDRAFDWLDRADREKDEWFLLLSIDPYADPLRSDPRFEGYVRRLRL